MIGKGVATATERSTTCALGSLLALLSMVLAGAACDGSRESMGRFSADVTAVHAMALQRPPVGLPPVPAPAGSAPTPAQIELGRKLFMDRRLSHNNTLSCAMCHIPEQGFTSNELRVAIGMEGRSLRRNTPTLYNVAYIEQLFADGREFSLENQVIGPLTQHNEMANPSIGYVIEKIKIMPDYRGRFEKAFNGEGPSVAALGQAIAAYERSLLSANSAFDRWRSGEKNAFGSQEAQGFRLFTGKAQCFKCHIVDEKSALFTDNKFHNTGIGWRSLMSGERKNYRVRLAPGTYVDMEDASISANSEPVPGDVGRYEVTLDPADRWAYRTPTLRNIALTAPYMHDGSIESLEEVIDFYDKGGIDNPGKDRLLGRLNLTQAEKSALLAFLRALTGDNVKTLAASARAAASADNIIPENDPASSYGTRAENLKGGRVFSSR